MPGPLYAYDSRHVITPEEKKLQDQGYPFVSTNTLQPGDALNPHSHHSPNNHYILRGSPTIRKSNLRDHIHRTYNAGEEIPVAEGVCYQAMAGEEGCVFVEGHRRLSVSTAERFVARGTLMRVDRKEVFEAEEHGPTECGK